MLRNIEINKQNIKADTGKAILIAMPHNSNYDGYQFWHPSKLVRSGSHSYAYKISYTEEFKFTLKKYGRNNEVIEEITLDYEDLEAEFEVMNNNIHPPQRVNNYETYKPDLVEVKEVKTLEELLDD